MTYENKDFYPTPRILIDKMLQDIDLQYVSTVLEPSAGKGDIVDYLSNRQKRLDVDTIEADSNLIHILKGKRYRVIYNDFLTFHTYKKYDLIIMNPPFSEGDKHLLHAINLQKNGGKIVCILNAETLKNPYSNIRKDLLTKLEELNAKVEYLENQFTFAERKTNVEIALININIPIESKNSFILESLKKQKMNYGTYNKNDDLISGELIQGIIQQYNFEVKAGINFINEYFALEPKFARDFENDMGSIFTLGLERDTFRSRHVFINEFVKKTRYKYWKTFFQSKKISRMLTSNLLQSYMSKLDSMAEYDFSIYNINEIRLMLDLNINNGIEECILKLFDDLSFQNSYNDFSNNIHYYNGWKTNKAWYINKKVILPMQAFCSYTGRLDLWGVRGKLLDIEKSLNYLSYGKGGNKNQIIDLEEQLEKAKETGQTKNIDCTYFKITFYKKGTCHIEFTDLELLKKLNIFGSQKKRWLPPSYGKTRYDDMTQEEKQVIDQFEGKKEYKKTMDNTEYFLYSSNGLLQLEEERGA